MSSGEQQWISTASMNRFYDHCYLIECAYHIISRYCCSFTNLLTHDDGSIPYYLVQKVKIAVEYGKILLNSRYRPFQHQLRVLGVYDYIDQPQYEKLCILWNTIKAETQIVEMYFNQISLLIYPVVSSTTLPFLESVDNEDVSALIKINAIIHTLINYDETSSPSATTAATTTTATLKKNVSRLLKSDSSAASATTTSAYLNEEELGVFIVNSIIEPLFDDEESSTSTRPTSTATITTPVTKKNEYFFEGSTAAGGGGLTATAAAAAAPPSANRCEQGASGGGGGGGGGPATKKVLRCMSPEISDFMLERSIDQLQALKNNLFAANDLCNIFKMDDQFLLSNIFSNSRIKSSLAGDEKANKCHDGGATTTAAAAETAKKYTKGGDNFRAIRYDNQKRLTFQRRYPKKGYDKKHTNHQGNYEFVNKKFSGEFSMAAPAATSPSPAMLTSTGGLSKNFV